MEQSVLRIRTPDRDFIQVAMECERDGNFDLSVRTILRHLRDASVINDAKRISYLTRAFHAFLVYKGGSYATSTGFTHRPETPDEACPDPPKVERVPPSSLDSPAPECASTQ